MQKIIFLTTLSINLSFTLPMVLPAKAQVTSDGTTNTTVNSTGNNFDILNGIQKGNNLFHSFKEFSIPTGSSATFNNSTDVVNIINRVTGGNISNIDGLIKANGNANLFLINPAGIVFGENASLNIGGSFFATTAESILFEDRFEFSAVNPQSEPLLTVSVPLGLQMGNNPGEIKVNGSGQAIFDNKDPTFLSPLVRLPVPAHLEVDSEKTLALVGGNVTLKGSSLRANQGRIELGGANSGIVGLQPSLTGWNLDYTKVSTDRDINLELQSAIDVSGLTSQGIQLVGKKVKLRDASIALMQVFGAEPTSGIKVKAKELVEVTGTNSTSLLPSAIGIESLGFSQPGDIVVNSSNLAIREGGAIGSAQFGSNQGSNVNLNISEEVIVSGISPINGFRSSQLGSKTVSTGDGGNVNLSTRKLTVENGAYVSSVVMFGSGSGGDVIINNAESIEVVGEESDFSSSINTSTLGEGNAGLIVINTDRLSLRDGGDIDSATLSSGNAGEIKIHATEFVEITSKDIVTSIRSAGFTNKTLLDALGSPQILSGNGGKIVINTPHLELTGIISVISVANDGTGIAGNLEINADSIFLSNGALVSASTASGEGGNIKLEASDLLVLRNRSQISATAGGIGNGGSIDIQAPFIVSNSGENNDIIANAFEGNGGNINITTQGVFGLKFREQLTDKSDITASSEFGINGTVQIDNVGIEPSSGLVELPELINTDVVIANSCVARSNKQDSTFYITGKQGFPYTPGEAVPSGYSMFEVRKLSDDNSLQASTSKTKKVNSIVEATGIYRLENGEMVLGRKCHH